MLKDSQRRNGLFISGFIADVLMSCQTPLSEALADWLLDECTAQLPQHDLSRLFTHYSAKLFSVCRNKRRSFIFIFFGAQGITHISPNLPC